VVPLQRGALRRDEHAEVAVTGGLEALGAVDAAPAMRVALNGEFE
jgi:hypothetical protein